MITIKLHRVSDLERLLSWRREVLCEVFGAEPSEELMQANSAYFTLHVYNGSHIAYVASADGYEAGCGAVCIYDEMPSPDNPSGRCAYLMNIYVRPQFRKQGIASAIVERLVRDAQEYDCGKIYLEATDMAHSLYSDIGFKNMNGFMKYENSNS